ncbi:MAG: hypothetical protein HC867_07460 [Bacteroidia bacterium]|nr:hypothetical protein [Bacteroidia bacterium]
MINKLKNILGKFPERKVRILRKLLKVDSLKAKELFGDAEERYENIRNKAAEQVKKLGNFSKVYSSKLDSLTVSFKFLESTGIINPEVQAKLKIGLSSISKLQDKLNNNALQAAYKREGFIIH